MWRTEKRDRCALEQVDVLVRLVDPRQLGRVLELVRVAKDARPRPVLVRLVRAKLFDERGLGEDVAERCWVAEDLVPDRLEAIRAWAPDAAAEERFAVRREVQVVTRERSFPARPRVVCAKVRFVGRLVFADCGACERPAGSVRMLEAEGEAGIDAHLTSR